MNITQIAHIRSDFGSKFGIPRQSGLAGTEADIIFEPEFSSREAVRGLEDFSYIWLIWGFSENADKGWHPTVRPPRLGGNTRMGVFATRSPFRPNPVALSSVRLVSVDFGSAGDPILHVKGADLMDGTPIYDIKPYIPYTDCHDGASGGFTDKTAFRKLTVVYDSGSGTHKLTKKKLAELTEILSWDPRPSYQHDPERVYGMSFAGYEIKFRVDDDVLTVLEIQPHT